MGRRDKLLAMLNPDWDDNWREDGCKRYRTSGPNIFTFCGSNSIVDRDIVCRECSNKKSGYDLSRKFMNGELDLTTWRNEVAKRRRECVCKKLGINEDEV